jgi:hypothetical protein
VKFLKLSISGAVLAIALATACAKTPLVCYHGGDAGAESDFERSDRTSPFGKAIVFELTDRARSREIQRLQNTTLEPIAGATRILNSAYLLRSPSKEPRIVLLPRLVLSGGFPVPLHDEKEELVQFTTSLSIFDGRSVQSSSALEEAADGHLVEKFVYETLGFTPQHTSSYPCPSSIAFELEGATVSGSISTEQNACLVNQFSQVDMTFRKSDWDTVVAAYAEKGHLELAAQLETVERVPSRSLQIILHPSQFKVETSGYLRSQTSVSQSEALHATRQALERAIKSFGLELAPHHLTMKARELVQEHFTLAPCEAALGSSFGCLALNSLGAKPEPLKPIQVVEHLEANASTKLLVKSKIRNLLGDSRPILLRPENTEFFSPPGQGYLNSLFLTIGEGETVELTVAELSARALPKPPSDTARIDNYVCLEPYTLCNYGKWNCTSREIHRVNERKICEEQRLECLIACTNPFLGSSGQLAANYAKYCYFPELQDLFTEGTSRHASSLGCRCSEVADSSRLRSLRSDETSGSAICFQSALICKKEATVFDEVPACERLVAPALPNLPLKSTVEQPQAKDFKWACTNETESLCEPGKWENQWTEHTPFVEAFAETRSLPVPLTPDTMGAVVNGLEVVMSSTSTSGERLTRCPLTAFIKQVTSDNRLILQFKNSNGCEAFNAENRQSGRAPSVAILNRIKHRAEFQCGSLVENWKGLRTYQCNLPSGETLRLATTKNEDETLSARGLPAGIHLPYYPRVSVKGSLRILSENNQFKGEKP